MSGSPNIGPIASQEDVNLVDQPGRQLGKDIAKLIKDSKVTMNNIQHGLCDIEEEEQKIRILSFGVLKSLAAYTIQQILTEVLEKNLVVREWFEKKWGLKMIEDGTRTKLDHAAFACWFKERHPLSIQSIIRDLCFGNELIMELLKKKLLVEQEDGTFAIRELELELDAIKGHLSE
ncbi:hypothetical protein EAE96_009543 [Botrytis aclada]|nr:hypothetical protein EAE96_009543 [Botrytis aclada]